MAGCPVTYGGIDEAFVSFYIKHWKSLVKWLRWTSDPSNAEDAAQEAMMVIRRTWGTYDRPDTLLYKVAKQQAERLAKPNRTVTLVPIQAQSFDELHGTSQEVGDGEQEVRYLGFPADIARAVRQLPRRQREVVVLHYACDRSTEDVAAILGMDPSSVRTHRERAIKRLGVLLGPRPAGDGAQHQLGRSTE